LFFSCLSQRIRARDSNISIARPSIVIRKLKEKYINSKWKSNSKPTDYIHVDVDNVRFGIALVLLGIVRFDV
jgi:hypothetical protein